MKLSEAIRLGAMLRPQGRGDFFVREVADGKILAATTSCALGAAYEAIHGRTTLHSSRVRERLQEAWPLLDAPQTTHPCPLCATVPRFFMVPTDTLADTITHLNDCHCWTREQIAVWVETFETETEPKGQTNEQGPSVGACAGGGGAEVAGGYAEVRR